VRETGSGVATPVPMGNMARQVRLLKFGTIINSSPPPAGLGNRSEIAILRFGLRDK